MREAVKRKTPENREKPIVSDKAKLDSEGPANILDEKWLLREVKRLGWDDKTAQSLLKIKNKLFKNEDLSPATFGQTDSVNMKKDVNDLNLSVHVNGWNIVVHLNSVSDKKRNETADGIRNIFKNNIPGIEFSARRDKDQRGYVVIMAGTYNKPDKDCEGGKNNCRIKSPPHIPTFHKPGEFPKNSQIRGC